MRWKAEVCPCKVMGCFSHTGSEEIGEMGVVGKRGGDAVSSGWNSPHGMVSPF